MKKIMFDDRFCLTNAVIDGTKTITRRIIGEKIMKGAYDYVQKVHGTGLDMQAYLLEHSTYKAGEVVAIAQKYDDVMPWERLYERTLEIDPYFPIECTGGIPGKRNKMFVKAEWMPFRIEITGVRIERLQDISDEDCIREGVFLGQFHTWSYVHRKRCPFNTPREAFAELIDRISKRGTWEKNPWVYVYSFKLFK